MLLRTRRILYLICFLIFLISAPALALYTAGFRYDFKYQRIEETGSLVIKSIPEGATVILNNKPYDKKTPVIINNILPGTINLQVSLPNYHDWQKDITIYPRVTTFEENARLLPKSAPINLIDSSVASFAWNKAQNKLLYQKQKENLYLFNSLNNKDKVFVELKPNEQVETIWSPHDDQFILIKHKAKLVEYFIGDANSDKLSSLRLFTNKKISAVQWDPNSPNTLYFLSDGALYRLPYLLKIERLVHKGPIINYQLKQNQILLLEKAQIANKAYLVLLDLSTTSQAKRIMPISDANEQKFLKTNSAQIAIYNAENKSLMIVDPDAKAQNTKKGVSIISPVEETQWSSNGQKLIYSDGAGIYEHYFTDQADETSNVVISRLLVRYSVPVASIFLLSPDENRLLYSVNDSLRVIEFGAEPAPRNTVILENIKTIKQPAWLAGTQIFSFLDKQNRLQTLNLRSDGQ